LQHNPHSKIRKEFAENFSQRADGNCKATKMRHIEAYEQGAVIRPATLVAGVNDKIVWKYRRRSRRISVDSEQAAASRSPSPILGNRVNSRPADTSHFGSF
jgi:hypothetical protein